MKTTAFELVIFDMDGTLLNSMDCLTDWLYRVVKAHCSPSVTPADLIAAFGPTEEKIIAQFVPGELAKSCLDTYYDLCEREHERVQIYPGINKLLKELQKQDILMALFTGKSRRAAEISLDRLGWRSLFRISITGDDIIRFKPDPEGVNLILERTRAAGKRTIFIGDSDADMAAARSAGIIGGRAEWGGSGLLSAVTVHSDHQFATPQAVIELLLGKPA